MRGDANITPLRVTALRSEKYYTKQFSKVGRSDYDFFNFPSLLAEFVPNPDGPACFSTFYLCNWYCIVDWGYSFLFFSVHDYLHPSLAAKPMDGVIKEISSKVSCNLIYNQPLI